MVCLNRMYIGVSRSPCALRSGARVAMSIVKEILIVYSTNSAFS